MDISIGLDGQVTMPKQNAHRNDLCSSAAATQRHIVLRHSNTSDNWSKNWPSFLRPPRPQWFTKARRRSTVMVLSTRLCAAFAGLQQELTLGPSRPTFIDSSCTCVPSICNSITRMPGHEATEGQKRLC